MVVIVRVQVRRHRLVQLRGPAPQRRYAVAPPDVLVAGAGTVRRSGTVAATAATPETLAVGETVATVGLKRKERDFKNSNYSFAIAKLKTMSHLCF